MLYLLNTAVEVVTTVLGGAFLLRFWVQSVRARPPLPVATLLVQLTDWFVGPLRKHSSGWMERDWTTPLGAIFMAVLSGLCNAWLMHLGSAKTVLLLALLCLAGWIVYGFMGFLIIEVIFSWINPFNPLATLSRDVNAPLLQPIRRFLPPLGGFDFSTLVAFFLLRIVYQSVSYLILTNLP